jgi:hypothetical protein
MFPCAMLQCSVMGVDAWPPTSSVTLTSTTSLAHAPSVIATQEAAGSLARALALPAK